MTKKPPKVRVFAGVEQLRNGGTRPAATGRLCEWKEDPRWSFCFWWFCQKWSFRIDFNTTMQDRKLSSKNVWFQFRQPACVIFSLNPGFHCRQPAFLFSSFGAYQRSLSLNCQEGKKHSLINPVPAMELIILTLFRPTRDPPVDPRQTHTRHRLLSVLHSQVSEDKNPIRSHYNRF